MVDFFFFLRLLKRNFHFVQGGSFCGELLRNLFYNVKGCNYCKELPPPGGD